MKETKVSFKSHGQKVVGILNEPKTKTDLIIIIIHGFTGDKDGPDGISIRFAKEMVKNGYAVLRFDFRGSGESEGRFEDMTISGEVSDLKKSFEFAREKGFKKIGVLGESMGGTVSIIGYDDRIECIVLWYPAIYLKETSLSELLTEKAKKELNKRDYVNFWGANIGKNFIEEFQNINVTGNIKRIKCPTLIIHGNKDVDVPYTQSEKLFELLEGPKKLEIISGADHCFHGEKVDEWQSKAVKLAVEWFKKWL